MTLILETGAGVYTANAYATETFVDSYLTERNRSTENSWTSLVTAVKEAAIIAATQYIDQRWGSRFKGTKLAYFDGVEAQGTVDFTGQPANDEVVVIGSWTYTFKTTLSTGLTSTNEVLIGATQAASLDNLVAAINGTTNDSVYSTNIVANRSATATEDGTTVTLIAIQEGTSGNDITLSTDVTGATATGFLNGREFGSQPLEFPRSSLFDRSGISVIGVPLKLKQATAEYAVRSASAELFSDPSVDASGRAVVKEKIGPIETQFAEGASLDLIITPYPAADYLIKEYIHPAGIMR